MSWLRLEGRMPNNSKVSALSDAAFRLYVTASCWCVEEKTDGLIPAHVPETLPRAPRGKALDRTVKELLTAGVWETAQDGRYVVHDHLKYNPSAAESEAIREAKAAAGAAGGRAKANGKHGKTLAGASPPSKQPTSRELAEQKQSSSPRAGGGAPSDSDSDSETDSQTTTTDLSDQSDPGRETMCPTDLDKRAEALGVLAKLAESLVVPIESIRHEAQDFREFYTFGGGAGQMRTGWMRQLRERIRKRHREGQLKPVSAIEHDRQRGRDGSGPGQVAPSKYLAEVQQLVAERGRG